MTILVVLLAVPAAAQDAGQPTVADAGRLTVADAGRLTVADAGRPPVADAGVDVGADAGLAAGLVVFRDHSDGQPLRLWSDGGVVTHTLQLDEMGNARADGVRLRASGLRDESGVSASPVELLDEKDAGLGTMSLGALESVSVRLRTSLDQPGTYRGRIALLQGGREQSSTEVIITWPRPALNVELAEQAIRVRDTTGHDSVRIPLTLRETAGLPASLYLPVLTSLTFQEDAADTATAFHVPATAKTLLADGGLATEGSFVLGRRQVLPVQLDIDSDLPGAGLYKGKVRIASAGGPPLDATFILYLRQSSGVAFLLILLGVLVSFGIRTYQTSERPRLLLEHRTLAQLQALDDLAASPECDDAGRELVKNLREQVDTLRLGISRWQVLVSVDALGSKLDVLERKVTAARNWVRLRKAVLAMQPASLQEKPLEKLEEVRGTLVAPGATSTDMDGAEKKLRELPGELQTQVRQHLSSGIQSLRDRVKAAERAAPTSNTVLQLTSRVVPSLDVAERELDRDFQAASRALDTARAAYASLLADELTTGLAGARPAFMMQDEWTALGASVNGLLAPLRAGPVLDTEAAVTAYEQAMKHYLRSVGAALFEKVKGPPAAGLSDAAKTALAEAHTGAESAVRLAEEGKLSEAQVAYERARARYDDAMAPPAAAGGRMGVGGAPGAAPAGVSLESLPEALSQSLRLGRTPWLEGRTPAQGMAWIGRRLWLSDLIVMVLTLALASLVGLKLLWVDDLMWGGWGDWLVALLWGFGLHQLVHPGLAPLIQRIIAPAQGTPQPAAPAPAPAPPAGGS